MNYDDETTMPLPPGETMGVWAEELADEDQRDLQLARAELAASDDEDDELDELEDERGVDE